eukprot:TRINITY_DN2895_c0_g1_i1.p2 TRINITY_DN2895_c0_g1~~TRINITY_DN2895_c0_g1_i1.p2  ORF type:complete len:116 (+),score=22.47 TRINITY_DN2895_c0_g1_i1:79-426(+)
MAPPTAHGRRVLRLYRQLMHLASNYPESELANASQRIPMSDDLRVEIRTGFKDHAQETDPERLQKLVRDGERLKKMLEVIYQDAFFRLYPTVRPYHTWTGLGFWDARKTKEYGSI